MIELRHDAPLPASDQATGRSQAPATLSSRVPVSSPTPDALKLLKALRRRWCRALILGLLIAVPGGLAAYHAVPPSKYSARAMLHVANSPKYIIFDPKERFADFRTYQRTQVAMVKSLFVLSDALRKPEVARLETVRDRRDAPEWLALQLKADFPDASEVFEISLAGDKPQDLVVLVNAVVDSYIRLVVDEEQEERRIRLETLQDLWKKYQITLQEKRDEIRKLSESVGTNDKQTLSMAHQSRIRQREISLQEQLRVRFELIKAESDLAVLVEQVEAVGRASLPQALVNERVDAVPIIQKLTADVRKYAERYNQLAYKVRNKHDPAMLALAGSLEATRRELATARLSYTESISNELRNAASKDDRMALIQLRSKLNMMRTYQQAIEENLTRLGEEAKSINQGSIDLSHQQDELQIVNETARKIGAEVEAMEVELKAPPRIRVVDRATVPGTKDELRKLKAGGIAAASSFCLVVFLVSFWEFRARRIVEVEEVVNGLGMRVVGTLPALPDRREPTPSLVDQRKRHQLVESVDAIRAIILRAYRVEGIRTVLITSAVPGEGKTSLACQLATSLARVGHSTILVDCDLRCASAHKLFDLPVGPGLCELLRNEIDLSGAVYPTIVPGLHLVPAGRSDLNAIQNLTHEKGEAILNDLKARYDLVIVDSAPVLAVADTLLIAQIVDGVIFSILHNVSRVPLVSSACERLDALGVRVIGAVVNGTPPPGGHSDYQYPSLAVD